MKALLAALQAEARLGGMTIDLPVYEQAGRDPSWPILAGSGDPSSRLAFMGRDPGRHEVIHDEPFIGAGGQLIRRELHQAAFGLPCPDLSASIAAGRTVFWCNTVPYKPIGNKAWSTAIKRRFAPTIARVLVDAWSGHEVITLGNVAFDWFGLVDPSLKPLLASFWTREDRYEASLELSLLGKPLRLHPLPHPSPLNATWFSRFPDLLRQRLRQLDWHGA